MTSNEISQNFLKLFYFLLYVFGAYLVIDFSPPMFPEIVADSDSYFDHESSRKAIYPLILKLCEIFQLNIIEIQKVFLSLSLIMLFFSLKKIKIHITLRILFLFLILGNIYYTSFSKVILTEAFFFGSINILISLLILNKLDNIFCLFISGLLVGFIASLKSIGILLALIFLIFSVIIIKKKTYINILTLLFAVILFPIIEHYYFFSKNSSRSSVLPIALIGKAYMLSGLEEFKIKKYPPEFKNLFLTSKEEFKKIQSFLSHINNPLLRADLSSDYETVAQYQLFKGELRNTGKLLNKNESELSGVIIKNLIKNNFIELINLSLLNYLGLWSIGSKHIFFEKYLEQENILVPLHKELKISSGKIMKINKNILMLALSYFIIIFLSFLFLTIFIILKMNNLFFKKNLYLIFFTLSSQIYLLLVGITNVATPRYLMTVYPMILIALFLSYNLIKYLKK